MIAMLALGVGIIVSSLTTRYRDLAVLVGFGVQLWMYATPVIYPLSALPDHWRFWASLNPVPPVMELFRYAWLGSGSVDLGMLGLSVVMITGILLFNRVERSFMDTI
jgi:lipopolysaccharide transport system permease protein